MVLSSLAILSGNFLVNAPTPPVSVFLANPDFSFTPPIFFSSGFSNYFWLPDSFIPFAWPATPNTLVFGYPVTLAVVVALGYYYYC